MSASLRSVASIAAVAVALAAGLATAQPASAPADGVAPPSAAERLLFMHPQLASLTAPRAIAYDYAVDGTPTDRATLTLAAGASGQCCATHVDFLSGPLAIALPDLDDPQGNPILMYFLESEVRQLQQATTGQAAHFRRRIRQALADDATTSATTVRWDGRDVPAQVVRIAPFVNDPYRKRFERESAMRYEFVVSDAVPGGLVRLSATLPGATAADPPAAARTLAIADPQPAARK